MGIDTQGEMYQDRMPPFKPTTDGLWEFIGMGVLTIWLLTTELCWLGIIVGAVLLLLLLSTHVKKKSLPFQKRDKHPRKTLK